MAYEAFEFHEMNLSQIHVRHIKEGHYYSFLFVELADGTTALSDTADIAEVVSPISRATVHEAEARRFATEQARARGRIA
jgi:hypothetical protein